MPQKPFLFTGTVASNLRYGNPDATDEELWTALTIAQARDFVAAMPEGIDSPITQGGSNVSGGQRQRLAIARALVAQPIIYLFDDSFSALDLATDARLRAALKPTTRDKTVIIVAQRVSTIADADQIIVLEDGLIVGVGTARRTARDLPHLRRDRAVPTRRGGVGMTKPATKPAAPERPKFAPPPGGRPGGGGPFGGGIGMPAEKSLNFGPSAQPLLAPDASGTPRADRGRPARRDQRGLLGDRTRSCSATPPTSSSTASSASSCRPASPSSRRSTAPARRATTPSPTCCPR